MLSRLAYSLIALFMLATVAFQDNALATGKDSLCVIPYRTYCENVGGKFYQRVEILLHKDQVDAQCTSSSQVFGTHVACNLKTHMFDTYKRDGKVWNKRCDAKPCEVTICGKKHTVVFYRVNGCRISDFCKFKDDFEDADKEEGDFDWYNVANALLETNVSPLCRNSDYNQNATTVDRNDGRANDSLKYHALGSGDLGVDDVILEAKCVQEKLCELAKKFGLNQPCCQPAFLDGCDDKTQKSILIDLLKKLADPRLHPKSFKFKGNLNLCEKECIELAGQICAVDAIDLVCNKYEVTLDKDFVNCWITQIAPQLGILSASEDRGDTTFNRDVLSGAVGDIYTQIKHAVSEGNMWIVCTSSEEVKDDKGNVVGLKTCYKINIGVTEANGNRNDGTWAYDDSADFYKFEGNKVIDCGKFCLTLKY